MCGSWEDFPKLEEIRETKQRDVSLWTPCDVGSGHQRLGLSLPFRVAQARASAAIGVGELVLASAVGESGSPLNIVEAMRKKARSAERPNERSELLD